MADHADEHDIQQQAAREIMDMVVTGIDSVPA